MINLTQIRGIGVATEAKLVATGYSSVEELAKASADKVSQQTSLSAKQANRIIAAAKSLINSHLLDNKTTNTKPKNDIFHDVHVNKLNPVLSRQFTLPYSTC